MSYLSAVCLFSRNMRLYLGYLTAIGFGFVGLSALLINPYLLRLCYGIEFNGFFGAAGVFTLSRRTRPTPAAFRSCCGYSRWRWSG